MNTTKHREEPPEDVFAWFDRVKAIIESGAAVEFAPKGLSMWPSLRPPGDRVTIARRGDYRRGDILLARSESPRGIFMHRVVDLTTEGYVLMGDANTTQREFVSRGDVAGAVTIVCRKGRDIGPSRLAARLFLLPPPLRRLIVSFFKRIYRP